MKNKIFKYTALIILSFFVLIILSGTVAAAKDLTVSSISASGHTSPGKTVTVSYSIKNQGTSNVNTGFYTYFYLTPTKSLTSSKTYLGSQYTSALSANSYISGKKSFKVPSVSYGTYYVAAKVDAKNSISESSKSNNIRYTTSKTSIYKLIDSGVTKTKGYYVKIDAYGNYTTGVSDQAIDGMLYPTNFYWETYKYPTGTVRIYTHFYHTTLERTVYQTITLSKYKWSSNFYGIQQCVIPKSWGGSSRVIFIGNHGSIPSTYYWKYFRPDMIKYAPSAGS